MQPAGLRVTVVGELPDNVMTNIKAAVSQAVLGELAGLAISPPLTQGPVTGQVDRMVAQARSDNEPTPVIEVLAQLGMTDPTGASLVGGAGVQEPGDSAVAVVDPA